MMFPTLSKILLVLTLFVSGAALADPQVFIDDHGVALSGYDPVGYFKDKKPVMGNEKFTAKYNDATYWFSSDANRKTFVAAPSKYAAQYGGYCAYAASLGKKAPGDPTQWTVVNNKLYVNYDERIQKQWSEDIPNSIKKADSKWESIKND